MSSNIPIELPAETMPLSETSVSYVLGNASSNNQQQIQSATKQLEHWSKQRGYYKHLQSVFIDQSCPLEVRYQAIIQLKNGIDKYWRKTAEKCVPSI